MAVYVDDMYTISLGNFRGMKMSHLVADSTEELLEFVDKIGVKRKWIQHEGKNMEHFDICKSKRDLAVSVGAIEIDMRTLAISITKRETNNSKIIIHDTSRTTS